MCPDCLVDEFAEAAPVVVDSADPLARAAEASARRQAARAESWSVGYKRGAAFSASGKLRALSGLVLFAVCIALFLLSSGDIYGTDFRLLPEMAQRPVSLLFCWAAAALIFTSTTRHKVLVYMVTAFLLAAGWFMPQAWRALEKSGADSEQQQSEAVDSPGQKADAPAAEEMPRNRKLSDARLADYRQRRKESPSTVHYAIYVDGIDESLRRSMSATLSRLLEAGSCVGYSCERGYLFIVERAAEGKANIVSRLSRFGRVYHSISSEGIYELAFDAETANLHSKYTAQELSPSSASTFVTANISELKATLDPQRVYRAALVLRDANAGVMRTEIRNTLVEVLKDSWVSEPVAYETLVEALVTYAPANDRDCLARCRSYILFCRSSGRTPSRLVVSRFISESPDEMVQPVIELWSAEPALWADSLKMLGTRPEKELVALLKSSDSIRLRVEILRHLAEYGTPDIIAELRPFAEHSDANVRSAAIEALRELEMLRG